MAILALAFLALLGYFVLRNSYWVMGADADTYYLAAERLRDGETLYLDTPSLHSFNFYRYAPWFAAAFMPLTLLPREVATGAFSIFALLCSLAVVLPLVRPLSLQSLALVLLIAPPLVNFSYLGNVQAPLVAAIMYLPGRWVWVGIAASLKFTPLALAIPDLVHGRWRRAILCIALAVALILPIFAFDLDRYMAGPAGQVGTWMISPWLTLAVATVGCAATALVSRRSYPLGMAAAAGTVILASPYLILGYLSWLAIPTRLHESQVAPPEVREARYGSPMSKDAPRS